MPSTTCLGHDTILFVEPPTQSHGVGKYGSAMEWARAGTKGINPRPLHDPHELPFLRFIAFFFLSGLQHHNFMYMLALLHVHLMFCDVFISPNPFRILGPSTLEGGPYTFAGGFLPPKPSASDTIV